MQEARLKEIQRRLGNDGDGSLTPMGSDVEFLLAALQEAKMENFEIHLKLKTKESSFDILLENNTRHIKQLREARDRERVLREALETSERHKQLFCNEMNVYKKGCTVLEAERDREIQSNEELRNRATYWHEIEMENFKLLRKIRELEEALKKEGQA